MSLDMCVIGVYNKFGKEKMTRRHVLAVLWMQFSRITSDWTSDWLIYNDAACIVLLHVPNMNMSVFLT